MVSEILLQCVCCPRCGFGLASKSGLLSCGPCRLRFPDMSGIPFVFSHPHLAWAEWQQKVDFQIQFMEYEIQKLKAQLESKIRVRQASSHFQKRCESLLQGWSYNQRVIQQLMKPLQSQKPQNQKSQTLNFHQAMKMQLPLQQKLMNYEANLYRDWCWGDQENKATIDLLRSLGASSPNWGRVLILGVGFGRLAYDLVVELGAAEVVALDINPFFLSFGQQMCQHQQIEFYEFPLAPRTQNDVAIKRVCSAPPDHHSTDTVDVPKTARAKQVAWIVGDGMNPPFLLESFDTIVTPWFMDIIPQSFPDMANKIHHLLKSDGRWINFGPFGFLNSAMENQWSREELLDMVRSQGFSLRHEFVRSVPYLQSPASAQKREEEILAFLACKTGPSPQPPQKFHHFPDWLEDTSRPVPRSEAISQYAFATQLQGVVLGEVDGHKSLTQIAQKLAENHGLSQEEAEASLINLFRQVLS